MANVNDKNNENNFPGYPHYPAKEDIMNSKDNERIELDVENLSRSNTLSAGADKSAVPRQTKGNDALLDDTEDEQEEAGEINDSDVTPDDLIALGEDEPGFSPVGKLPGEELDVPGAEEDDANEEIGEEDEENNYYSLGGEAHDNLEEDKG